MPKNRNPRRTFLHRFLASEASGGIILMVAAAAALIIANSPLAPSYFGILSTYVGPLNVAHWINDALMALFFLLVGLEIKREFVQGELSTWSRRVLPGFAALGGMVAPALIFLFVNRNTPETTQGWAIPTATDIAFALGVLALLGRRVPISLKVFLTALAIIDDLGAVIIIAVFYTSGISGLFLGLAAATFALLVALNLSRVSHLAVYLAIGVALWFFVYKSGVHATVAGVLLAMTIPLRTTPGKDAPLVTLEHALHRGVAYVIVPLFGFANAGVALGGLTLDTLAAPLTLGISLGLVLGKLVGVFGFAALLIRSGFASMPAHATWSQLLGVAMLCGIGFTMSLFVSLLAFADSPHLMDEAKLGILMGSMVAGLAGALVLLMGSRPSHRSAGREDTQQPEGPAVL